MKKNLKKVIYLIDSLEVGGAERSLLDITKRFKKYNPLFITIYKGNFLKSEYEKNGLSVISLNLPKTTPDKEVLMQIENILKREQAEIVHATLLKSCLLSRRLRKRIPILVNSLVNNTYSRQRYKTLNPIRAIKLMKTQLKDYLSAEKVTHFISNSETIKQTTVKAIKLKPELVTVIYRGRDKSNFNNQSSFGQNSSKIFINVGRLIPQKGQIDLVKAFRKYLDQSKMFDDQLWLIGEGPLRKELEVLIKRFQLETNIKLLGRREDVPALLVKADYFVFPSYYEGLPGSLIEAIFSKLPIIASNIPENLECVTNETARIYPAGNIDKLALELEESRLYPEAFIEKIEVGYERALQNFDIERISEQYELLYEKLISKTDI